MTDLMQQVREQFEAWSQENFGAVDLSRFDSGDYRYARTRSDWELWQAAWQAAALRAAPEAEALRIAMTTLEQIASTPRNKGARMNAKATLLFLQTQLAARPQGVSDGA